MTAEHEGITRGDLVAAFLAGVECGSETATWGGWKLYSDATPEDPLGLVPDEVMASWWVNGRYPKFYSVGDMTNEDR